MADYLRPQFPPKNHPGKDEEFYREWSARHWYCAACGRTDGLSTHHLIKAGRAHEACVLLRLCWEPCHMLAEGLDVPRPEGCRMEWRDGGFEYHPYFPKLTIGICLSLKLRADPGELSTAADWQRLEQLRGSRLPDLEEIPELFQRLFKLNRPEFGKGDLR